MAYVSQSSVKQMLDKGYSLSKISKTLMISTTTLRKRIQEWGYTELAEKNARLNDLNNPLKNSKNVKIRKQIQNRAKRQYGGFDNCM